MGQFNPAEKYCKSPWLSEKLVTSAKTRNSSLFSRIFFRSLHVHVRKKAKETRANWRPSGLRSNRFLSKRAGRSSKRMGKRASLGWKKNHFASLISFVQGRRARGRKFTSFVSNYPRLSFIVFAPRSRFCYLSVPAIQAIKTKFNWPSPSPFTLTLHPPLSPSTLTLHPSPSPLTPHPSPSPFTLTLHPRPAF